MSKATKQNDQAALMLRPMTLRFVTGESEGEDLRWLHDVESNRFEIDIPFGVFCEENNGIAVVSKSLNVSDRDTAMKAKRFIDMLRKLVSGWRRN